MNKLFFSIPNYGKKKRKQKQKPNQSEVKLIAEEMYQKSKSARNQQSVSYFIKKNSQKKYT